MKSQPIKNKNERLKRLPKKENKKQKYIKVSRHHKQEYGTSKLEDKFAHEFLDKLGVVYVRQFKADSIERYYDFFLPNSRILIEVDGDYW